jgi:pimeloyl-ACP methyl ester carboxylesterase
LHQWLARIGYNPFFSGIGFNTECPNLLIRRQLNDTIEKALTKSGRKLHLIGHSLGGIIARYRGAAARGYRFRHHLGVRLFAVRSPIAAFCVLRRWSDGASC